MTANPQLADRPLFNAEKDFAPISQFIEHPWLLYVNAQLPARTLAAFVALAQASAGRITLAARVWVRCRKWQQTGSSSWRASASITSLRKHKLITCTFIRHDIDLVNGLRRIDFRTTSGS